MQKIIKQDLGGSEIDAQKKAQYTWKKGEIAWYFCNTWRNLFEVKFTGKHWIIGNRWSREKIYQYKYLSSTSGVDIKGLHNDGISHGSESSFFSERSEALAQANRILTSDINNKIDTYNEDMKRLNPSFELNKKLKKLKKLKI